MFKNREMFDVLVKFIKDNSLLFYFIYLLKLIINT